ncbi:hypothetical protein GMLC_33890 [Geomonas limicola]|uniref:TIGR00374 family protein n=2 Tax=Geomonas limicola TaxID=2740186 RepID=A0A6V8NBI7_9BACT|nr:hypothetical protein GMLC_33890 [Geomonas limicola]
MRRLNLALLAVASLVMFLMLHNIDWGTLAHSFWQGSRYWPLLLLPYGATTLFWTLSWYLILLGRGGAPAWWRLYLYRLAGESLNQLTPTASLGGEPFKAQRLNAAGVSWPEATASLVIHKALMVVSLVFYILISLALTPQVLPGLSPRLTLLSYLGTLILAGAGAAFLVLQRRHPCSSFLALLSRVGLCPAVLRARSAECAALDQALEHFYHRHAGAGLAALLCYLVGWALHAVEVWVIFWLLGHPIGLPRALCLDALCQLVAGLGFMIPVSLGVQDGGTILLSLGFNLGATLGTGFTILRRFREAFWLLLGLVAAARGK